MPFYEGLCTIKRGGVFHPPGTIHEFDELEATALGAGRLRPVNPEVAVAHQLARTVDAAPVDDKAPSGSDAAPVDEAPDGADNSRVAEIVSAIDLLDEGDFEEGLPKMTALSAVLGFEPSDEEVSAALALREEQGHGG